MDHDGPNDGPKIPENTQILVFYEILWFSHRKTLLNDRNMKTIRDIHAIIVTNKAEHVLILYN